jgi:hypothetical protein
MTTFQNFLTGPPKCGQRCPVIINAPTFNLSKWYSFENRFGFGGHGTRNGEKAGKTQASDHA